MTRGKMEKAIEDEALKMAVRKLLIVGICKSGKCCQSKPWVNTYGNKMVGCRFIGERNCVEIIMDNFRKQAKEKIAKDNKQ